MMLPALRSRSSSLYYWAMLACALAACGGAGESGVDGHELAQPNAVFYFDHSEETGGYTKDVVVEFDDCRMTLGEYSATDESWWHATCSQEEKERGRSLLTDELVAIYEAETEPLAGSGNPHCRIAIFLPPTGESHRAGYQADEEYSEESQELMAFFIQLYESYPRPGQ